MNSSWEKSGIVDTRWGGEACMKQQYSLSYLTLICMLFLLLERYYFSSDRWNINFSEIWRLHSDPTTSSSSSVIWPQGQLVLSVCTHPFTLPFLLMFSWFLEWFPSSLGLGIPQLLWFLYLYQTIILWWKNGWNIKEVDLVSGWRNPKLPVTIHGCDQWVSSDVKENRGLFEQSLSLWKQDLVLRWSFKSLLVSINAVFVPSALFRCPVAGPVWRLP